MTTIKSSTTTTTAYSVEADTTGALVIQTGAGPTTAVTVSSAQVVTLANPLPVASGGSGGTTSTGTGANVLGTTPSFTSTIGVGAATASASGAGITFPATQSASTDANTLDDYEEGTWTGTIKGSTTDPTTPVTNTGTYTKIGRQVFARISFGPISTAGAAGDFSISGLPFSSAQAIGTGNVMTYNIVTFASAGNLCPYVSGTNAYIYYMVSNSTWVASTHNAGTSRYLELSVTYNV
jgi:hypothetical protein